MKKKQEEEIRKVEKLKSSVKELNDRESKTEEMLQSASGFLQEGDRRMAEGLAEKDMDEIEAAQKVTQLAHQKQKKHKMNFKLYTKKRESLLINLEKRLLKSES